MLATSVLTWVHVFQMVTVKDMTYVYSREYISHLFQVHCQASEYQIASLIYKVYMLCTL